MFETPKCHLCSADVGLSVHAEQHWCPDCLWAKIERLQAVILEHFSYEPSHVSTDLDVIGLGMVPLTAETRATIIRVIKTAAAVGDRRAKLGRYETHG